MASVWVLVVMALLRLRTHVLVVDDASRTLRLKVTRWPRRSRLVRVAFDDVEVVKVCVALRVLHWVIVVDAAGAQHVVAGPLFRRARAVALARTLEERAGLEPVPDDEWLRALRAVRMRADEASSSV